MTWEKREGAHQAESNTTTTNGALTREEEDDGDAVLHGFNCENKHMKGMRGALDGKGHACWPRKLTREGMMWWHARWHRGRRRCSQQSTRPRALVLGGKGGNSELEEMTLSGRLKMQGEVQEC